MELISREELKEKVGKWKELKLLFALGEWQYRAMHIPGSRNLPASVDLYRSPEILQGLDPDDEIVVYCSNEACLASICIYYFLVHHGFKNVRRYAGGLLDWEKAGYPLAGDMAAAWQKSATS